MKKLHMNLEKGYDITIGRGLLDRADSYFDLNRKVLIISDTGVPREYAEKLRSKCKEGHIIVFKQGEASKNIETYKKCIAKAVECSLDRKSAIVAVGGGVVGDLAGFVASSYMRGIDFYNVATTTLSSIDSSIGGKVAIDYEGYKNIVGAFYQPKGVLIDLDTLKTLDARNVHNGLVEAIKTGLIGDKALFEMFENEDVMNNLEEVIYRSLCFKKRVVEEDEKEMGIRKILNFGHTIGHGIESFKKGELLHGECVGLGMLKVIDDEKIKDRLRKVLVKYSLPVDTEYDEDRLMDIIRHDKKGKGDRIDLIKLKGIGEAVIETVDYEYIRGLIHGRLDRQ